MDKRPRIRTQRVFLRATWRRAGTFDLCTYHAEERPRRRTIKATRHGQ